MFQELSTSMEYSMQKTLDVLKEDLASLRTGRAHPDLLGRLIVEAYGNKTPLKEVAHISVVDPQMLSVKLWDTSIVSEVEKSLGKSDFNPNTEGGLIRVPIPPLSQERRKEMQKMAAQYKNRAVIAIQNLRRDVIDKAKKEEKSGACSKDDAKIFQNTIEKIKESYIKKIDDLVKIKEKDLMA